MNIISNKSSSVHYKESETLHTDVYPHFLLTQSGTYNTLLKGAKNSFFTLKSCIIVLMWTVVAGGTLWSEVLFTLLYVNINPRLLVLMFRPFHAAS